jgi:stress response protein SCP2
MTEIQRGFRGKIDDYFNSSNEITTEISVLGNSEYDSCCVGVDVADKLSDENYMIFFNQTASPKREIVLNGSGANTSYNVNLVELPNHICKLVFTVSIDGNGDLGEIQRLSIKLSQGDNALSLNMTGTDFHSEKAVIAMEIYKTDFWRVAVVASGFNGGLPALLKHYGGVEDTSVSPQQEPIKPSKDSLEKRIKKEAPQLLSLAKPLDDNKDMYLGQKSVQIRDFSPAMGEMFMELANAIKQIAKTYSERKDNIKTEEATKMSLIAPMIQALGYNIFDPSEVNPEYDADLASKKLNKIDYAILNEGKPIMIMECKWSGTELTEDNKDQLLKYFVALPDTKIAILTNGLTYKFFTDLDKANYMDTKPYFSFDIRKMTDADIKELSKYGKPDFKLNDIMNSATELKYTNEIKKYIGEQLQLPDDQFVKTIMKGIEYPGHATANVVETFKTYTKNALDQFLDEKIKELFSLARKEVEASSVKPEAETPDETIEPVGSKIVTTQDEIDGFNIVRAMLRKYTDAKNIVMRDTVSCCGVLFKGNNRMPICRLYFNNPANLQLALIELSQTSDNSKKVENKVKLASLDDIYVHEEALVKTLKIYLE